MTSAKTAVLAGSVVAALFATVALRRRARHYAALAEVEERDDDGDGIPDIYRDPTQ